MTERPTIRGAVALALLATACGSCHGGLTDPVEPRGPGDDREIATLTLSSSVAVMAVGQSTVLEVEARTADDRRVPSPTVEWRVAPEGIVRVAEDGALEAEAAGTASVTAHADDVASNPVELRVVSPEEAGTPSVRVTPRRVVLAPGGALVLDVAARDGFGQRVVEPHLVWATGDSGVATVDEDGRVRGVAAGETTVTAQLDGVTSPPAAVRVSAASTYAAVDWIEPSGDAMGRATLRARVRVQDLAVGSPSEIGVPLSPTAVELRAGDTVLGTLTASFGEASGEVPLDGLAPGDHEVIARATVDGATVDSPPLALTVLPAGEGAFDAVGDPIAGDQGSLAVIDGVAHLVVNDCTRECRTYVHRWDGEAWDALDYQRREWDAVGDWQEPTGFSEDVGNTSNISLPRFQGWGWPPRSARDPEIVAWEGRPLVVWSNQEARTSFNEEAMPERFWFDCYGAEWSASAGYDGAGGFSLLSAEGPEYLFDHPHPDAMGDRDQYQFPSGIDATRTHDCLTPRAAPGPDGRLRVAYLAGPVPGRDWGLEVRAWDPGPAEWTTVAPRFALEGTGNPSLRALAEDGDGRLFAAVVAQEGPSGVHRLQDGSWSTVEPGTRRIASLAATSAGSVIGGGTASGDARVYLGADTRWSVLGFPLDADPWRDVGEVAVLVAGDDYFAAWTEGPASGNRVLYVARWDAESASWRRLGGEGAADAEPDRRAVRPSMTIDADGHLWVIYTEDVGAGDDPFVQRVLRSREPVQ